MNGAPGGTLWGDLMVNGGERRREIRHRHGNGLDAVEVDHSGRRLVLTFLEHAPAGLHPANLRIDGPHGGPQVTATSVRQATENDARLEDRLLVELASSGGAGPYTLSLVERTADGHPGRAPLRGFDPRFAQVVFAFDIDLPNPVPGNSIAFCPAPGLQASYLARDYEGLRQLVLDRLTETMPAWTERHAADIGITLVELLAAVGDDLSYYQDATATEAYLQTARQRISVRRHARLVDYILGEGGQARAWLCLAVSDPVELPIRELVFVAAPAMVDSESPILPFDALRPGAPSPVRPYTPVRATLGPPAIGGDDHLRGPTVAVSPAHNCVGLWAWGEKDSRLLRGATTAVLVDGWVDPADHGPSGPRALALQAGDVVVFEATIDRSGIGPPDPTQRHPVRLTAAHPSVDRLYGQPVIEITWAAADALPFDLQITAPGLDGSDVPCAVVRANTVLVGEGIATSETLGVGKVALSHPNLSWASPHPDPAAVARHQAGLLRRLPGQWRHDVEGWRRRAKAGEALGERRLTLLRQLLGEDVLTTFGLEGGGDADDRQAEGLRHLLLEADRLLAPRIRRLRVLAALAQASGPLSEPLIREVADEWGPDLAGPLNPHRPGAWGPAGAATSNDARRALPILRLSPAEPGAGETGWTVVRDVVDCLPGSRQFMVEVDDAGLGHLRFSPGDQPTGPVTATYQVGQGAGGNLPAEAINAVVALTPAAAYAASVVQRIGNPLPATGGTDPETIDAAKAALPGAFLIDQPRALVAADYTALAIRVAGVRRAATVLRWTGARYAADIAVQPSVGEDPDEELLVAVDEAVRPCRRIGHDLWVRPPTYRPLVLGLNVDVGPDVPRADVATELTALLGSGWQTDGTPGLFNPARMAFGQPVYASPIVAAAQCVAGVEAVTLTRLCFLGPPGLPSAKEVPERLLLQPSEIARLDNDPAAPEQGYATVNLSGGR